MWDSSLVKGVYFINYTTKPHQESGTQNLCWSLLDEVWLGCGERQGAKVCVINCELDKLQLEVPSIEVSPIFYLVEVFGCVIIIRLMVNTLSVTLGVLCCNQ